MKTQHFIYCIAIIAVCFTACKKDKKEDYRANWVGTYDFTIFDYHEYGGIDNLIIEDTTIHFIGIIEIYGVDRLKITFKPDAIEPFPIKGIMYPILYDVGTLSYPEYMQYLYSVSCSGDFTGFFTGTENRIVIKYDSKMYGPLGLKNNESHHIEGIKINK